MIRKKSLFLFALLSVVGNTSFAMNLLMPHDTLIRPPFVAGTTFQFDMYGEAGINDAIGYNSNSDSTNVLQIWNCDQNGIAMLDGFPENSAMGMLRSSLGVDNGVRGHFCATGDLHQRFGGAFAAHYYFLPNTMISAYLPVYSFELENVRWQDKTLDVTNDDRATKELLTNDFFNNVCQLSDGLSLQGWDRSGVGDLALLLEWFKDYYQRKPMLKNVRLNGRFGFSFPSGLKRDEDKIFALPFGNDGAVGLIAGGGLDAMLGQQFKLGFDVHLMHAFSNTRDRRIKTNRCQTDLLLLAKTCVQKDFGLTQRFNLYFEGFHVVKGFSFKVGYQFLKHGDDEVAVINNEFSSSVANTAHSLEEYMMHHAEFSVSYDFGAHLSENAIQPYIEVFARVPFNGTRVALSRTVGAVLSLRF